MTVHNCRNERQTAIDLPTARDYLKSSVRLIIWCKQAPADRQITARVTCRSLSSASAVRIAAAVDRLRGVETALGPTRLGEMPPTHSTMSNGLPCRRLTERTLKGEPQR